MSDLKINVVNPAETPWPDFPVPAEWIREGTPDSRGMVSVESSDAVVRCGQWSCTPCKFRWDYDCDEFVLLLEGEAEISTEQGDSYTIRAGDMVHFPKGLKATWEVRKTVRKVFFLHSPQNDD